jgi:hypothetical protein
VEGVEFYFLLPLNAVSIARKEIPKMPLSASLPPPTSKQTRRSRPADGSKREGRRRSRKESPSSDTKSLLPSIPEEDLIKPSASYACLIAEAITSTEDQRLTLSGIYEYLIQHYDYFKHTKSGWQNSIRHNLSLNKAFKKLPRASGETGKGSFWIVDPNYAHLVENRRRAMGETTPGVNVPRRTREISPLLRTEGRLNSSGSYGNGYVAIRPNRATGNEGPAGRSASVVSLSTDLLDATTLLDEDLSNRRRESA